MTIRQRGNSWVADVKLPCGKRIRKQFDNKHEAEEYEVSPIPEEPARDTSIGTIFKQAYKIRWQHTKNAKDIHMIINQLIAMCGVDTPVDVLDKGYINKLIQRWLDEGNSHKRINRKLAVLRPCIQFAIEDGAYTKAMPSIKSFKEGEGRLRYLTEREAGRLLERFDSDMSCLFEFLLFTGCRVGEAFRVKWSDVHETKVTFWETKSGKPRTIPLVDQAIYALAWIRKAYPDHSGPFDFTTYDAFHKAFQKAREAAGLGDDPQVVPHVLRHTCASWLVQRGVNIVVVSKWLGHSDISVTMRYAHLAPDDLTTAAQVLEREPP